MQEEERGKIDGILALLDDSGVAEIVMNKWQQNETGRDSYNPCRMFAAVLLAFALGHDSLREMESACRNDLRFIYVLEGECPTYATFSNFINKGILPSIKEIYALLTKAIFKACGLAMDTCFIDGTKFEADANRYEFVWKPTRWHETLDLKIRKLLDVMGLYDNLPHEGFLPSSKVREKLAKTESGPLNGIEEKAWEGMRSNLMKYLLKLCEYEEKEAICGDYRNSYYKTDHDATAMCLKRDYYSGLGSSMHAAYSSQFVTCHGFIVSCMTTQDRSDMYVLIPAIDRFHEMYGVFPARLSADAGYGCTENWKYCKAHNIRAFIKYNSFSKENSGRYPAVYELNKNLSITCLGGRTGYRHDVSNRHPKHKGTVFYLVENCDGCKFMPYCHRFMKEPESSSRIFDVPVEYVQLKQEARDILLSVEGIEMRVNRSIQAEGVFGAIKQDMAYTRLRRTSLPKAELEIMLMCLGFNIRKYMRFLSGNASFNYWRAPEGTQPQTFKKPSAKRLANRVAKAKAKGVNEVARDSHKYKKIKRKGC